MNPSTVCISIQYRIPDPIHIQISALHDGGDLRGIGIRFQPEFIFALVDLLGIIAVDRIGGRPVGVLLGEAADIGIVIPRAEIVGLCLAVVIFAAVAGRANVRSQLLFGY